MRNSTLVVPDQEFAYYWYHLYLFTTNGKADELQWMFQVFAVPEVSRGCVPGVQ